MAIHVRKSEGVPTTKPEEIGMHYIDTLSKDVYISAGRDTLSDWILVGNVTTTFTTFLSLLDTPIGDYSGQVGKSVKVNPEETALIFGNESLNDLSDVVLNNLSPTQVLAWDEGSQTWINDNRMNWKNVWIQRTYYTHEVSRDGNYTMVANKETTDRAAPVPEGDPAWALPSAPTWTSDSDAPQAIQGLRLEVGKLMELSGLRLWRASDSTTVTYDYQVRDITNVISVILASGTMPTGAIGWVAERFPEVLVSAGKIIEITMSTTTYQSSSNWQHEWTLGSTLGGVPALENLTVTSTHDLININKQADGAVDASSDISLLKTGDEILLEEVGNTAKYDRYRVTDTIIDQGAYFEVEVLRISNGQASQSGKLLSVTAIINATIDPSDYTFLPNFWFNNSPFTGALAKGFFKTDPDALNVLTDNAYGIDLEGTVFDASPDWDLLALSGSSVSGTGGGGSTLFIELEDTPSTYLGHALEMLRVNGAENQLEYTTDFMRSFNGRTGDVLPESGDYTSSDVGAYSESQTDTEIDNGIAVHVAEPDPHPQYVLPSDLPSIAITYMTGVTSSLDGAYLLQSGATLGNLENSVNASGGTEDVPVLVGQWLRDAAFDEDGTLLETGSVFTIDYEAGDVLTDIRLEIGVRTVGAVYNVLTSQDFSISMGRSVSTFDVTIPQTDYFIGDTSFIRIYVIKKEGGGAPKNLIIYMEGSYVTRVLTNIPGQSAPGPHASTHEIGGSDQVSHDLLSGANGFDAHSVIDSRNNAQDISIGDNATAITGKEDGLGNPVSDGEILSSTIAGVRSWISTPPAHAATHEVGGSDQIDHDQITGASGHDSHATIDSRNNSQDTDIGNNTIAISGKEDDLGNPAEDGYLLSSTQIGARTWVDPSPSSVIASGSLGANFTAGTYTLTKTGNLITFNWTYATYASSTNVSTDVLVPAAYRYPNESAGIFYYSEVAIQQRLRLTANQDGTYTFWGYTAADSLIARTNNGESGSLTYAFIPS